MFRTWCEAGFDPAQYWVQTPRLLDAAILGFAARRKAEQEGLTYVARLAAGLGRWPKDKRLPSLDELLTPAVAGGSMPPAALLNRLRKIKGVRIEAIPIPRRLQ